MSKIEIIYNRPDGSFRCTTEEWNKTELNCPACGDKKVWMSESGDCADCGSDDYICLSCGREFSMTRIYEVDLKRNPSKSRFLSLLIADLPKEKQST